MCAFCLRISALKNHKTPAFIWKDAPELNRDDKQVMERPLRWHQAYQTAYLEGQNYTTNKSMQWLGGGSVSLPRLCLGFGILSSMPMSVQSGAQELFTGLACKCSGSQGAMNIQWAPAMWQSGGRMLVEASYDGRVDASGGLAAASCDEILPPSASKSEEERTSHIK